MRVFRVEGATTVACWTVFFQLRSAIAPQTPVKPRNSPIKTRNSPVSLLI